MLFALKIRFSTIINDQTPLNGVSINKGSEVQMSTVFAQRRGVSLHLQGGPKKSKPHTHDHNIVKS